MILHQNVKKDKEMKPVKMIIMKHQKEHITCVTILKSDNNNNKTKEYYITSKRTQYMCDDP